MKMIYALMLVMSMMLMQGSNAAECLGRPHTLSAGAGCGAALSCGYGLFCANDGTCKKLLKETEDCSEEQSGCGFGLACKGPGDEKRCVANVHPGQDCSRFSSESVGNCGTNTNNCVDNVCTGGYLGDACRHKDDCAFNMTCNGVCEGIPIGQQCISHYGCVLGAYCDDRTTQCTAQKTQGPCDSEEECARDYVCLGKNSTNLDRECVMKESRQPGEYCNMDIHCASSLRCESGTCAAEKVKYCYSSSVCAGDQVCSCGGLQITDGIGTCSSFSCVSSQEKFQTCFDEHCRGMSGAYYNGSCAAIHCEREFKAQDKCGDASFLSFSLFTVTFLTLFATFFSNL